MNVMSLLNPKVQVAYLYEDDTIRQGLEKLRHHGYTALPVLTRDGGYAGTVSEGDFLWYLLEQDDRTLRGQERAPLRTILRGEFNPPVDIRVTREELLERSMQQSFVPVVDDRGAFVGIVTRQAILRALAAERERPARLPRHGRAAEAVGA